MVQSKPHGDVIVRMRTRAFAGRMASHRVMVEPDGSIQVYDAIAGHYTRAHSMPKRDQTRARRMAAERVREQEEGSYTALEACIVDGEHPQSAAHHVISVEGDDFHDDAEIPTFLTDRQKRRAGTPTTSSSTDRHPRGGCDEQPPNGATTMATHDGKTLYLDTTQGRYVIHPDGGIERTDMHLPPSGQWMMVGLYFTGRGGGSVPLEEITPQWVEEHAGELDRWTVLDLDHGTHRTWGSRLRSVHFYERPEDTNYYRYTREHLRSKVYRPF